MNSSFLIPHSSFIIACRNEINNLTNLLASIEKQTYKPDEVIFIDDNSTDETYDFLINYSKKNNYIKVIKNNGTAIRKKGVAIPILTSECINTTSTDNISFKISIL